MDDIRFRLMGFPVAVQAPFFVLLVFYALFALQRNEPLYAMVVWSVVVFVSILVHELGHAWMARTFRVPVHGIFLHGFGGHVTHGGTRSAGQALAISLAGPFAGLALGLGTLAVSGFLPHHPIVDTLVGDLLWVNIGWSLVNLLPMMPLDGGNALVSALSLRVTRYKALRWGSMVGVGVAVLFAAYGFRAGSMFLMMMGGYAAWVNWNTLQEHGGV